MRAPVLCRGVAVTCLLASLCFVSLWGPPAGAGTIDDVVGPPAWSRSEIIVKFDADVKQDVRDEALSNMAV